MSWDRTLSGLRSRMSQRTARPKDVMNEPYASFANATCTASHQLASAAETSTPLFGASIAPPMARNAIGISTTPSGRSEGRLRTRPANARTPAYAYEEITS